MSAKKKDNKNRWRNKTVAFRMSPEEAKKLEYLIHRALQEEVTVRASPTPRTFKMLRNEMESVLKELQRIGNKEAADSDLLDIIRQINRTLYGMKEDADE